MGEGFVQANGRLPARSVDKRVAGGGEEEKRRANPRAQHRQGPSNHGENVAGTAIGEALRAKPDTRDGRGSRPLYITGRARSVR